MTGAFMVLIGLVAIGFVLWMSFQNKKQDFLLDRLQLPEGWVMEKSVPTDHGGVVDLIVTTPKGKAHAVTVRSQYQHLEYTKNLFGEHIALPDGRHLKSPCPLAEALSNAQLAEIPSPVLWFPLVREGRSRVSKQGVIVVFGDKRKLIRAMK